MKIAMYLVCKTSVLSPSPEQWTGSTRVQAESSKSSSLEVGSASQVAIRFARRNPFVLEVLIAWNRPSTSILFDVDLDQSMCCDRVTRLCGGF
jgi:hypothetical protein